MRSQRLRCFVGPLCCVTTLAVVAGCHDARNSGDWWVVNANIITVNPAQPRATQLHVRGGRIAAVGDGLPVPPGARRVDARGRTMLPGLIDAHVHLASQGRMLAPDFVDARGATSPAQVAAMVAEAARVAPKGEWILGRNWDQSLFVGADKAKYPSHQWLTDAAPDHPVALRRTGGHAVWVNGRGLALAGLTKESQDPPGGMIIRDADGAPAGVLVDAAAAVVQRVLPDPSVEDYERWLVAAGAFCVAHGLTTVHDAGVGPREWQAYQRLARRGALPVRVYAMLSGGNDAFLRERLAAGPAVGLGDGFLTMRAVKLFADGALGSHGAWLFDDYADRPGHTGLPLTSPERMRKQITAIVGAGFQPCTHAIGDRAINMVLDIYEHTQRARDDAGRLRLRIEHAQHIHPDDFARFARLGVIASMQPTHATTDQRFAERRLGPSRLPGSYAWRTLLHAGARLAGGSDFPVEEVSPIYGVHAAVTRRDRSGHPPGGWLPDQRLTVEEAIRLFTLDAAYAAFEEDEKGSLEPGKLADFILIDRDPMAIDAQEIHRLAVEMTVIGGRIIHRRS